MCGIAGIFQYDTRQTLQEVTLMTRALAHRGPDGEGFWKNVSGQMVLGHRRLAVIDRSAAAAQPLHYRNRYTIVHNGEIYNYRELRETLSKKGYVFATGSDTEVIPAAYDCYGESCLAHLDGMFAFVIWDEERQTLFAARDRFGEKPFYYHFDSASKKFSFASEPKSFRQAGFRLNIQHSLLLSYLTTSISSNPTDPAQTFYVGLQQLPAAHYLMYRPQYSGEGPVTKVYWQPNRQADISLTAEQAVAQFRHQFQQAVSLRMRSDVPLGTSLSGGIDSAAIAATLAALPEASPHYRHTCFTAVFPGFEKDESAAAQNIARQWNLTQHTTAPDAAQFAQDIDQLIRHHEEPISSASVYAQYKVFELAATHGITVLLDGQGADELLAGYTRYHHWYLQELLRRGHWKAFVTEQRMLRENNPALHWGWKNILAATFPKAASLRLTRLTATQMLHHPDIHPDFAQASYDRRLSYKPEIHNLNDLLIWTACHQGLQELLRYADRNAMAFGRELRLPYLQPEWAEWMLALPSRYKIHQGYTKWILRKSMEGLLPRETVWQKNKIGFEPPQRQWMEHPLVQEKIRAAKEKGVKEKYLHPRVLDRKPVAHDAYDSQSSAWRQLVAGTLFH